MHIECLLNPASGRRRGWQEVVTTYDYDLFVIGQAQRSAYVQVELKRVGVAEENIVGGIVSQRTIPSTCCGSRSVSPRVVSATSTALHGTKDRDGGSATPHRLCHSDEMDVIRHQLQRNGIDLHTAWASFVDDNNPLDASGTSQHTDITVDKV